MQMQIIPGATVAGDAISLPSGSPHISSVVSAYILRLRGGFTITDHAAADVIAAVDDHAVHGHDITTVVAAGAGAALTEPAVAGPFESAGGGQRNPGVVDALAAAQAHAATATDVAHAMAGASPVVAAVPTWVSASTFSLDVNTQLGDIVYLLCIPYGTRLLVA